MLFTAFVALCCFTVCDVLLKSKLKPDFKTKAQIKAQTKAYLFHSIISIQGWIKWYIWTGISFEKGIHKKIEEGNIKYLRFARLCFRRNTLLKILLIPFDNVSEGGLHAPLLGREKGCKEIMSWQEENEILGSYMSFYWPC